LLVATQPALLIVAELPSSHEMVCVPLPLSVTEQEPLCPSVTVTVVPSSQVMVLVPLPLSVTLQLVPPWSGIVRLVPSGHTSLETPFSVSIVHGAASVALLPPSSQLRHAAARAATVEHVQNLPRKQAIRLPPARPPERDEGPPY
jgi:hypothetical protein